MFMMIVLLNHVRVNRPLFFEIQDMFLNNNIYSKMYKN